MDTKRCDGNWWSEIWLRLCHCAKICNNNITTIITAGRNVEKTSAQKKSRLGRYVLRAFRYDVSDKSIPPFCGHKMYYSTGWAK
jgi:hypothetical protein